MQDPKYLDKILSFKSKGIVIEISGELKIYKSSFLSLEIVSKHFSSCNDSFVRIYIDSRLIDMSFRDICNNEYMSTNYYTKADFILTKERELLSWSDNYIRKLEEKWKNNHITNDEARTMIIEFLNILSPQNRVYIDNDDPTEVFWHNVISLIKHGLENTINFKIKVENI